MKEALRYQPIPKEYVNYTDEEKINKTEAYFERIKEIYGEIKEYGNAYRERINRLLQSKASMGQIAEVMLEKKFEEICYNHYDFCCNMVLCQIAIKEEAMGLPVVFHNVENMEEAVTFMQRIVFYLRRLEFDWEEEAAEELVLMLKEGQISYLCIAELICQRTTVRKFHTATRVANFLNHCGMLKEAIMILVLVEQLLPYSEEKIMSIANALLELGQLRQAYEILLKYENPNIEIKELQQLLKERL